VAHEHPRLLHEIFEAIVGPGLARGYHCREDETAARFLQHPRLGRIYRTGDLVRWSAAGELEYLGRLDGQVKLRGYRIELGAVESQLAACSGVRAAACRVQGTGADQVLVAHVVSATPEEPPDIELLKQALRRSLPAYMVPSRFGFLNSLPTTVGGKLDRRALPDLEPPSAGARSPVVAPRNDRERAVADAFAAALRRTDEVRIEHRFPRRASSSPLGVERWLLVNSDRFQTALGSAVAIFPAGKLSAIERKV
jgi:hypothetical protein